jgi:YVTN family beta-propeller protein
MIVAIILIVVIGILPYYSVVPNYQFNLFADAKEVSEDNIKRKSTNSDSDTNSIHSIRDGQVEGAKANLVVKIINLNESLTEPSGGIISVNTKNNFIYLMDSPNSRESLISIIDGTTNRLLKNEIKLEHFNGEKRIFSDPRTNGTTKIEVNFEHFNGEKRIFSDPRTELVYVILLGHKRGHVESLGEKLGMSIGIPILTVYTINSTNNTVVNNFTKELPYLLDLFHLSDIAINPKTNMVYYVYDNGTIFAVNFKTNTQMTHTNVGGNSSRSGVLNELDVDPDTNKVYVANADANRISVMNGSNLNKLTDISVPNSPYTLTVDPDTNKVYVANADANRISIIDGKTDIVSKNIVINYTSPSIQEPKLSFDADTNLVYLATSKSNLHVIDSINGSVVGNFILENILSDISDIDINPTTNAVYLTSLIDDSIVVINGKRDNIFAEATTKTHQADYSSGINTGSQPTDIAVNPINNIIYVTNFGSNTITAIDGNNDSVISSHPMDDPPSKIALNPSLNRIYILKPDSNMLLVFDGGMKTINKNFAVGMNSSYPNGLFVNPTKGNVYVTNHDDPNQTTTLSDLLKKGVNTSITIIDGKINNKTVPDLILPCCFIDDLDIDSTKNTKYALINPFSRFISIDDTNNVTEIELEELFGKIAVNPITKMLYGTDYNFGNIVYEIDLYTNNITKKFSLPYERSSANMITDIAINPTSNILYMANGFRNTVYAINLTDNIISSINVGKNPYALDVNPKTNMIYVANRDSDTVSVIDGSTNQLLVGLTFNIQPPNAANIICVDKDNHEKEIPVNTYIRVEFGAQCKIEANSGFMFTSWTQNLGSTLDSTKTISTNSDSPLDLLLSFLGVNQNENSITLKVSKYGSFVANFNNPIQLSIPTEFWAPLYALIPGFFIPSIISWLNGRRQRGYLKQSLKKIGEEEKRLIEKNITDLYITGKINDEHYRMLKDKISEHYKS